MTRKRAGWMLAFVLSLLWLAPAALWWDLGRKADVQERFVHGDQVHSFPYRHVQHEVGRFTLYCLGVTVLAWVGAGVYAAWRRRSAVDPQRRLRR
jgi:hypothetical protein